jgi:hypothetical protein
VLIRLLSTPEALSQSTASVPCHEWFGLLPQHRPVLEHTEIEEELHERANIDYDRVDIVRRMNAGSKK